MTAAMPAGFTGPYRGLEPFDESAAAFFFGREREASLIVASLFAAPLTLLYGASGVGKSSVLRAGVLPRLRQRGDLLPVMYPRVGSRDGASSIVERGWQDDPVSGLKESIALALFASTTNDAQRHEYRDVVLRHDMSPLREFAEACAEVSGRRLMVILDQFEEYSLYHPDEDLFARQFPDAVTRGDRSVSYLVSLREDALSRLDRFKRDIPTLWDSYRRIEHLSAAAAEEAMRLPLEEYNRRRDTGEAPVSIEDRLVEEVLRDVQAEAVGFGGEGKGVVSGGTATGTGIETPYLQLVMTRLWERERELESPVLRWTTLRSEGGAGEIVRTHLDRVMEQFNAEERDVAARIFHRLVTPSGAKIAFTVSDLAEYEGIGEEVLAPMLRRLEEGHRRILRRVASRGDAPDAQRYEIFHDRLGAAILAWRARRKAEQERDTVARQEAEQRRLADESRAALRTRVEAAMARLGEQGTRAWLSISLYLMTAEGRRLARNAHDLASLSRQPVELLHQILETLVAQGVLRRDIPAANSVGAPQYEVLHDAMARTLLHWQSEYVLRLESAPALAEAGPPPLPESPAPSRSAGTSTQRRFPFTVAARLFRSGRIVPFVGAGVSLSAGPRSGTEKSDAPRLPTGREFKERVAGYADFPAQELAAASVTEVASYFAQTRSRSALEALTHEMLGRADLLPSETHRVLAEIAREVPMVMLTTNYDALLERALADAQVEHDVVGYLPDEGSLRNRLVLVRTGATEAEVVPADRVRLDAGRTIVMRLHGAVATGESRVGTYVLTEEEQIDWITRLRGQHSLLPPAVLEALSRGHLLSLGHSAGDWTQRALLRAVVPPGTGRAWAVALHPSPLSVMTWQRYNVDVYNEELAAWADEMRRAWRETTG